MVDFRHRPAEVELLFQLLRVFTIRHVPDFHFLKKFLDETVAKVSWIRIHLAYRANRTSAACSVLVEFVKSTIRNSQCNPLNTTHRPRNLI